MTIKDVSEVELLAIAEHLATKRDDGRPTTLVGGWAVYAYNPYEKSTDIDLVLGSKRRAHLMQWLRDARKYAKNVDHIDGWTGATRHEQGIGTMIVDVAGYDEEYRFEDRTERLDFDLALDHFVMRPFAGHDMRIPTRSLLILYKAKAAFDRSTRLAKGTSPNPEWEASKLVKDRSDIIAILDSKPEAPDWEIGFLGEQLARLPFLVDVLRGAVRDDNAVARYGRADHAKAMDMLDALLAVAT